MSTVHPQPVGELSTGYPPGVDAFFGDLEGTERADSSKRSSKIVFAERLPDDSRHQTMSTSGSFWTRSSPPRAHVTDRSGSTGGLGWAPELAREWAVGWFLGGQGMARESVRSGPGVSAERARCRPLIRPGRIRALDTERSREAHRRRPGLVDRRFGGRPVSSRPAWWLPSGCFQNVADGRCRIVALVVRRGWMRHPQAFPHLCTKGLRSPPHAVPSPRWSKSGTQGQYKRGVNAGT